MVQGAIYPLPHHQSPSWLLWQAGSSLHQQSSYYQRAARSRSHRQGDTHSRFHWLVLKLPLRLITNPHDHSLIVEDLFRLRNRPVTSGRLVFIAALSAQRTSLSLKVRSKHPAYSRCSTIRCISTGLVNHITIHEVERGGDMMVSWGRRLCGPPSALSTDHSQSPSSTAP